MAEKYNQDDSINQQWLAEEIASKESGAKEIDLAQIKEILKITLDILYDIQQSEPEKLDDLLESHK